MLRDASLLHWLLMHPEDIAKANFLKGDGSTHFTNLQNYDIVELRAVAAVLPLAFEFDNDGKKSEWRSMFLTRLKAMVQQERQETIKCGWDPETQGRREVGLPALTAEQSRRSAYFYPSDRDVTMKMQKLAAVAARLEDKKKQLVVLQEKKLPEAKHEYDKVLEDTRQTYFKQLLGKAQLTTLKDEAKRELSTVNKDIQRLSREVAAAERAVAAAPVPRDEYLRELEAHRLEANGTWRRVGGVGSSEVCPREPVDGPFEPFPPPPPSARASLVRKLSAEEEAEQRRLEIAAAIGGDPPAGAGEGETGSGGGGGGTGQEVSNDAGAPAPRRRSSVKDALKMFQASGGEGGGDEGQGAAQADQGAAKTITAEVVQAQSRRVSLLLQLARDDDGDDDDGNGNDDAETEDREIKAAKSWTCQFCSKVRHTAHYTAGLWAAQPLTVHS